MTEEAGTAITPPTVAITPTIKKSPPKPKPTQPPSADNSVLAVNCCKILMTGDRSRFVCKHPGCEREYASRDAVRKHCRLRHLAWLRSLKRTAVHDIEVLSKEAEAALPPPPRREPKRAAAVPPPPPSAPPMPQMPYSPGLMPISPAMTPSLMPIEPPMVGKMPSLNWELNRTPAQVTPPPPPHPPPRPPPPPAPKAASNPICSAGLDAPPPLPCPAPSATPRPLLHPPLPLHPPLLSLLQMPSAGDSFLIKDLPPLDAPGAAPDWSVRDINWGTLTGEPTRPNPHPHPYPLTLTT